MTYIKKILYIGTGEHIEPVIDFIHTQEFIFIDTQPFTEFDYEQNDTFMHSFCRKNFVGNIIKKCLKIGFRLKEEKVLDYTYVQNFLGKAKYYCLNKLNLLPKYSNPTLLFFENNKTKQIIKYYVSTSLKNNIGNLNGLLEKEITTSDAIIISGHDPDSIILDFFTNQKIFIGYTKTCYENDDDDDTIISLMNISSECEIKFYFSQFYLVKFKNYSNYRVENNRRIKKFDNFEEFKKNINIFESTDEDI